MDLFEYAQQTEKLSEERESKKIFAVGELTADIKRLLKQSFGQQKIWVKGEVSNFRGRHQSGHMYFRLKDAHAVLTCVFFKSMNMRLKFDLEEGMEVIAGGRIDVWEKGGNYQFTIEEVQPAGQGDLHIKFEQLKRKLQSEGLFNDHFKKPLPPQVNTIGVITSPTGAVIRDIIHVVRHRCPYVKILLYPVSVQGDLAKDEISRAIAWFNQLSESSVDVLIVGRGGGSIEDLWAFNEEVVVRAIHQSKIPIISAVGHQTDFTLADFVADQRAATPSQAAELAVPDMSNMQGDALALIEAIIKTVHLKKQALAERLKRMVNARVLKDPYQILGMKVQQLDYLQEKMAQLGPQLVLRRQQRLQTLPLKLKMLLETYMQPKRLRFEHLAGQLSALNPLAILERGYSVVKSKHGQIIDDVSKVKPNDYLDIRLFKGELECQVSKIKKSI